MLKGDNTKSKRRFGYIVLHRYGLILPKDGARDGLNCEMLRLTMRFYTLRIALLLVYDNPSILLRYSGNGYLGSLSSLAGSGLKSLAGK